MRAHIRVRAAVLAFALAVTAACSAEGQPTPQAQPGPTSGGPSASTPPPVKSFDPPRTFATTGVPLPALTPSTVQQDPVVPVTLVGTTAYIAATDSMQVMDTRTGAVLATILPTPAAAAPTGSTAGGAPVAPTAVISSTGKKLIIAPFTVRAPGQGTTPAHTAVAVTAVDTADNTTAWNMPLPLPGWASSVDENVGATVVGVHDTTLMISVASQNRAAVFAVDIGSHQVLWQKDDFRAGAVAGDSLIGAVPSAPYSEQAVVGVSVLGGAPRWNMPGVYQTSFTAAGPAIAAIGGADYGSAQPFFRLVDANSGTDVAPPRNGESTGSVAAYLHCRYDGTSVTVCTASALKDQVIGLDATTGKLLWQLPDPASNRVAPKVTTAWHGAVYGTTDSGPVVLDARTGADRENAPGIAPAVVDATTGIALDTTQRTYMAYPATG